MMIGFSPFSHRANIPRYDLLAHFRVLLEKRMLTIAANGLIAEALRAELLRWGHRSSHQDPVFAAALACRIAGGQPLISSGRYWYPRNAATIDSPFSRRAMK